MSTTISLGRTVSIAFAIAIAAAAAIAAGAAASRGNDDNGHGDGHRGSIGTVSSFDANGGELAIDLSADGTLTGIVDEDTRIECRGRDGDDHGEDGPGHDVDDDNDDGSGHERDRGRGHRCEAETLGPGRTVGEAEADVSAAGLVFEEVEVR